MDGNLYVCECCDNYCTYEECREGWAIAGGRVAWFDLLCEKCFISKDENEAERQLEYRIQVSLTNRIIFQKYPRMVAASVGGG